LSIKNYLKCLEGLVIAATQSDQCRWFFAALFLIESLRSLIIEQAMQASIEAFANG
jgi:hypothetical protein